jgi:O-antigen/teichoic acid export membrane protein
MRLHDFKSDFFKSFLTLFTGTSITRALPVLISPLLTRLYTPEDWGVFALFMSSTLVITVFASGRYELAIMLPKNHREASHLGAASFVMVVLFSALTLAIVTVANSPITHAFAEPDIAVWLLWIPVSILFTSLFRIFNFWSNRRKRYRRIATGMVVQGIVTAGVNLAGGVLYNGPAGLILGTVMGQASAAALLGWTIWRDDGLKTQTWSPHLMKSTAIRYKQFPLYSTWSAFLNILSLEIPVFILNRAFSSSVTGFYSLAYKALNFPVFIIRQSFSQIFLQRSSEIRENESRLSGLVWRTYTTLLMVAIVPCSILLVFGDHLFGFIFGSEWITAGRYAQMMSPWILFVFTATPISMLFIVLEQQKQSLVFNAITLTSRIAALWIGIAVFQDPSTTVLLFSLTGFASRVGVVLYLLKKVGISVFKTVAFTALFILPPPALLYGVKILLSGL